MSAECRCDQEVLLHGVAADDYSTDHLVRDVVAEGGSSIVYRCPQTGRRWIGEFVPDEHGVTGFRLRKSLRAAELVELLARDRTPAVRNLVFADPDVEFRPAGSDVVYHGYDAVREWVDRAVRDPERPRETALSVIDVRDDEVVVLGSVAFKRGGEYQEHRPAAWLVTTREGRVVRSLWFDSWSDARKAAGVKEGEAATRRIGRWMFAVAAAANRRPRLA